MHPDDNDKLYDYYFLFEYEVVFKNDNVMFKYDDRQRDVVISHIVKCYWVEGDWKLQAEAFELAIHLIEEKCKGKGPYEIETVRFIREVPSNIIKA